MSDVLSQSEIDALLNRFDAGELELLSGPDEQKNNVRDYDFRTANRFHKEQIRTLNVIFETFARLFATYLSGTLRVMCSAEVKGLEELKYQEFVNALPSPVILAIMRQPPLVGPVLFELSPDIAYAMISRLLGGSPGLRSANSREFTEIELVLMERMLRQFMPLFVESWEKIDRISVSLDRIETSPQFAQIVASNETVAIISISVSIGGTEGLVNVCLPQLSLEPVNDKLSTRMMYQTVGEVRRSEPAREEIGRRIRNTPLHVTAVFNDTQVTVRDIMNLAAGDVLQLDHGLNDAMTIMVGHLPKFRGALGTKDNRYAVKISDVIHKEDLHE